MSAPALNLLVFRDGARQASGSNLKAALAQSLQLLPASFHANEIPGALLRAGELECALSDCRAVIEQFKKITDSLAAAMVNSAPVANRSHLLEILSATVMPEKLTVSAPEGFAYYALHPLAFAKVLDRIDALPARVMVVGIRGIGTTLSAITVAALCARGVQATRTTVRPAGHPYNRHTDLSPEQLALVKREISSGAGFLVVDEGPGLSGSSFLSVAEALARAGVDRERITLICSHLPEIEHLRAENAPHRWRQFRCVAISAEARRPAGAEVWIGGGEWRNCLLPHQSQWPASWLSFERLKYLSRMREEQRFYKFLGFGHYGSEVLQREQQVAAAGFGPDMKIESEGFGSYAFIDGRPMSAADISESVLARLAAYCVFRVRAFATHYADLVPLQQMAEHDLHELRFDLPVKLLLERPVIADGRMQPHEWILTGQGQMLKVDSGSHGDDHFFPGATDIAWDLAGAIVEWQMNSGEAETFLDMYCRGSGDDACIRVQDYIRAYTVFRCAYCLMAANAMQGTEEQQRLESAAAGYGAVLMQSDLVRNQRADG